MKKGCNYPIDPPTSLDYGTWTAREEDSPSIHGDQFGNIDCYLLNMYLGSFLLIRL